MIPAFYGTKTIVLSVIVSIPHIVAFYCDFGHNLSSSIGIHPFT